MKRAGLSLVVAAAALAFGLRASADSWALPRPHKYYSESRRYYLEVIPPVLESHSQYLAEKKPGTARGAGDDYCRGVFYRQKDDGAYEKVWERRLSNQVAPVEVLVSDGGQYVATFDNWHFVGQGDDVVVIYGPGGRLVRKMALTDIVPKTSNLPRSVNSIFWGGKHYIDERSLQLVLKVLSGWTPHAQEGEFREVRVDLRTGEFVEAKAVAD